MSTTSVSEPGLSAAWAWVLTLSNDGYYFNISAGFYYSNWTKQSINEQQGDDSRRQWRLNWTEEEEEDMVTQLCICTTKITPTSDTYRIIPSLVQLSLLCVRPSSRKESQPAQRVVTSFASLFQFIAMPSSNYQLITIYKENHRGRLLVELINKLIGINGNI